MSRLRTSRKSLTIYFTLPCSLWTWADANLPSPSQQTSRSRSRKQLQTQQSVTDAVKETKRRLKLKRHSVVFMVACGCDWIWKWTGWKRFLVMVSQLDERLLHVQIKVRADWSGCLSGFRLVVAASCQVSLRPNDPASFSRTMRRQLANLLLPSSSSPLLVHLPFFFSIACLIWKKRKTVLSSPSNADSTSPPW